MNPLYRSTSIFILLLLVYCTKPLFAHNSNILLYLPFDGDSNSQVANDKPIIKGSLSFAPGKVGSALLIGGEQKAWVEFQGEKYIDPKQGTIMFWVNPVDWDSSKEPDFETFHFFDLFDAYLYRVWKDSVTFYCNFPDDKVYRLYTAKLPLRKRQWAHIALSWLDNILKIYTNGEVVGQFMLREPMRREWQGKGVRIGKISGKRHALLDDFYIFDYPLSTSEIKQTYETSSKGKAAQLPEYKPFRVYVTHYPASSKAYICLDAKHGSFASSPVKSEIFLMNSKGQSIALGSIDKFDLANQRAAKLVDLPENMSAGNYSVSARIFDASGRELAANQSEEFEKRVYPWEDISIGLSDEVIPPFTPLKINNSNQISCWGREYLFKGDGFPKKIETRKAQILSAPITLEATINGANLKLGEKLEVISQNSGVIMLNSTSNHDYGQVDIICRVEYDGILLYNIKLIPRKEVSLDKLLIRLPIRNDNAKLYHVCRDNIRLNSESGYLPKSNGKIWGSSVKTNNDVLGTFIPYFWIGDYDRGFGWMADNDKNWSVPDGEDCVEFIRDDKALTAIVNFIKSKKIISKPWEISFALMAGPPRPEPKGWRLGPLDKKWSDWFCGNNPDTLQGFGKPPNFPKYLEDVANYKKSRGYWGVNTSPNDFWGVTEENNYFQLEWCGGTTSGYPLIHRNNFVMYTLNQLMSKGYIDGLYSDNTFPVPSRNLITAPGYVREDGKIQSGYSMVALRDFFKRSAYLFRKYHCSRSMMVHMTDAMIMPCFSFWDIKNDNEWEKHKPGVTDHIDAWSLGEICARSMSRQYGMGAMWHTPADWKNSPETGGDDLVCLLLLHDILGRTANLEERTSRGKSLFAIGEPDVEFLGYWVLQPDKDPEKKDVKVSAWVRKASNTALVVVANLGKEDWVGKINLPLQVMGLKPNEVASDAEVKHGPAINFDQGELSLSVPRHNYRFLLIGPKGHFPANLSPLATKMEKPKIKVENDSGKPKIKAGGGPERPKMNVVAPSGLKSGPPTFLKKIGGGEK